MELAARTDTPELLAEAVSRAVELLGSGHAVALPTETVYGLAADATRAEAVARIFEVKERPFFDPLIIHLPGMAWLERVAAVRPEDRALVDELISRFWPGPLTLVLPRKDVVADIATAGLPTVAVRMSAHPVFRAVIEKFGRPRAAPSANRFGRISPTSCEDVISELGGRVPLMVDGGCATHGLESTIVRVEGRSISLLRAGPVTKEMLAGFGEVAANAENGPPSAPGMLKSHYAPRTPLRVIADSRGVTPGGRCGLLALQPRSSTAPFEKVEVLSETHDLREAAARLFAAMRRLDEAGLDLILAEEVPETGLGAAIMERLRKASHE